MSWAWPSNRQKTLAYPSEIEQLYIGDELLVSTPVVDVEFDDLQGEYLGGLV